MNPLPGPWILEGQVNGEGMASSNLGLKDSCVSLPSVLSRCREFLVTLQKRDTPGPPISAG